MAWGKLSLWSNLMSQLQEIELNAFLKSKETKKEFVFLHFA